MAPMGDEVSVAFRSVSGDELRFDWELERLRALDPAAADPPPWRLAGDVDWDEIERVRVLSTRFEDGPMLALAAILPAGAGGHGEEAITGLLIHTDGGAEELDEVLLSTEYGTDRSPRRVGLELYRGDAHVPLRIAGESTGESAHADGGIRHEHVSFALRGPGGDGVGALDILRAE